MKLYSRQRAGFRWHVLGAMLVLGIGLGVAQNESFSTRMAQTEAIRTSQHDRYVIQLAALGQQRDAMTPAERWNLDYLNAWEYSYEADYVHADPLFERIIKSSGSDNLRWKASALLMDDLDLQVKYPQAYALGNQLMAELPLMHDALVRETVLEYIAQLLRNTGQYDLAADYVRRSIDEHALGAPRCKPEVGLITVFEAAHSLKLDDPVLPQALADCRAAHDDLFTHLVELANAGALLNAGQARAAAALLEPLVSPLKAESYSAGVIWAECDLARAYQQLGDLLRAHTYANEAVMLASHSDDTDSLRESVGVLSRIDIERGDVVEALANQQLYEKLSRQRTDETQRRALAYTVARQDYDARFLQAEKLAEQNQLLEVQRALDRASRRNSLLLIGLLLAGAAIGVLLLFKLRRQRQRYRELARRDGLTGILNHPFFMQEGRRQLLALQRQHRPASLICMDLDHFKQVNDRHGHAAGDEALQMAVSLCQQHLGEHALFARVGGEEFAILLPDSDLAQAAILAEQIRASFVPGCMRWQGEAVELTASFGVASSEQAGYRIDVLLLRADAALYQAKRNGRNAVVVDAVVNPSEPA